VLVLRVTVDVKRTFKFYVKTMILYRQIVHIKSTYRHNNTVPSSTCCGRRWPS